LAKGRTLLEEYGHDVEALNNDIKRKSALYQKLWFPD
jgi:hypothetical protein